MYLDHRAHLHPGVHRVPDLLIGQPEHPHALRDLARVARMSERNLTRVFRQATGIPIGEFVVQLHLELAKSLLASPELTLEGIAARCGFESARQLRQIWREHVGMSPSAFRRKAIKSRVAMGSTAIGTRANER